MAGFSNPWYAEIIERFSPPEDDENGNASRALLAGMCIIAQAIDQLSESVDLLAGSMPSCGREP